MEPIKRNGLAELEKLHRRIKRSYALRRIGKDDFDKLSGLCNELEATIVGMREWNDDGEEVGTDG